MHVPAHFRVTDEDALWDVVDRHGFAELVTVVEGGPELTLAPFVRFEGRLWGHLARANPQSAALDAETDVLVVFRGPHAYISPRWYLDSPNVPTWNYVAVHVRGVPRVLDRNEAYLVLERTVAHFDDEWRLERTEYAEKLAGGVVAFELEVRSIEGQFKLSQNHPLENRLSVIEHLGDSPVARLMEATL
jgi:transcriptional regulator